MPFRRSLFLLLPLLVAPQLTAAELNKATFDGLVFLRGTGKVPYVLTITYGNYAASDLPYRRISSIDLTFAGKKIGIPPRAFEDLLWAHRPWPLYTHGVEPQLAFFDIEGGDGAKSYTVRYVLSKDRLLRRELTRHLAKEPEVMVFNESPEPRPKPTSPARRRRG